MNFSAVIPAKAGIQHFRHIGGSLAELGQAACGIRFFWIPDQVGNDN
ncbi:MAG: hypothetical protein HYV36_01055 [Lentisphaerae bacterium]|nr:hypothetical protein [Lentisphaerota bacterium]